VLVCREETERVEGVRNGLARIVGTDPSAIFDEVVRILGSTNGAASRKSWQSNPYGDGHAAERIADRLQAYAKSRADRQREHEASATNQLTALGKRLTHVHR
jgi:UDP-N-acetylglucosamine 2-epimerase (non-hydrolysing)